MTVSLLAKSSAGSAMALPESHQKNRNAFSTMDSADPVFSCYCKLVALELALKDLNPNHFNRHHDVAAMIIDQYANDRQVRTAANTLVSALVRIYCTRDNSGVPVSGQKYPELRYTRRNMDFSKAFTSDANITALVAALDNILSILQKKRLAI